MSWQKPWMLGPPQPFTSHSVEGAPASLFSSTVRLRVMVIQPDRKASPIITALRPIRERRFNHNVYLVIPEFVRTRGRGARAQAASAPWGGQAVRGTMAAGNQAGRMREVASVLEICGDFVHPDPSTNAQDCCRRIPNGEPAMAHNILVICSDQHWRDAAGCYGHPLVETPNMDRLAARGTLFTRAYCADPCCVSTRASIQTGRWVHQHGCWSSAEPYDGAIRGWGHRLQDAGRASVSIGKLHFRSEQDNNGFSKEIVPVHVLNGIGFTSSMVRDSEDPYGSNEDFANAIGRGESSYTRYDRKVCELTCEWLRDEAPALDRPWALFSSFVASHHPIIAPDAFYDLYDRDTIDMPRLRGADERPRHPVLDVWDRVWDYDRHFRDDEHIREARRSYYGYVSFLDHHVGRVIDALKLSGQADDTLVIYTSDHGEMLGNHGMWAKMNMYEEASAIPMIAAGPGVPKGAVCDAPVSHVDVHPPEPPARDRGSSPGSRPWASQRR